MMWIMYNTDNYNFTLNILSLYKFIINWLKNYMSCIGLNNSNWSCNYLICYTFM